MINAYPSKYHQVVFNVEESHFWFRGRRDMLRRVISHFLSRPTKKTFLEVGFGTGEILPVISSLGCKTMGIDMNKEARECANRRHIQATLYVRPFLQFVLKNPVDAIGMFDVLEHQDDDVQFLTHARTCLADDGLLFLTVPAMQWLWSGIDMLSGHKRRYTQSSLRHVLETSGFKCVWSNYWNAFLLPFYALWKAFGVITGKSNPSYFVSLLNPVLNTLFFYSITIENKLTLHMPFLFGTSLVVVARKKAIES